MMLYFPKSTTKFVDKEKGHDILNDQNLEQRSVL